MVVIKERTLDTTTIKQNWQFAPLNYGPEIMDNAARHHFSDDPVVKMIREIIQNSLDARNKDTGLPAVVKFHDDIIPIETIAGQTLRAHVDECYERTKQDTSARRLEPQYQAAALSLSTNEIRCLRIVDSNTSGLKDGKFHALVRQEGGVDKDQGAPGGSYGIGKNATFNISSIKTVFYSTSFLTKRGRQEQMEGKTLLIPHKDPFNKAGVPEDLQHAGYYRNKDGQPVEGQDIDRYFHLDDFGTGVFIMGFDPKERDWVNESINAILCNFAYSTRQGYLEVHIESGDTVKTINNRNLEQRFEEQKYESGQRNDTTTTDKLQKAYNYYQAYRDSTKPAHTKRVNPLGKMCVWINTTDGPRQTLYINRNGMSITDARSDTERNPFGPRNRQVWPSYAAVVMPDDDSTNDQVRKMENPAHDQINLQALETEKERNNIRQACNNVRSQIADIIEQATGVTQFTEASNAEEIRRFVPEQKKYVEGTQLALLESKPINHTTVEQRIIEIQAGTGDNTDPVICPGPDPGPDPGSGPGPVLKPSPKPTPGPNTSPDGTTKSHAQAQKPRIIRSSDAEDLIHAIFTPSSQDNEQHQFRFVIRPTGTDYDGKDQPLRIKSVTSRTEAIKAWLLDDGTTVEVQAKQGERIALTIQAEESLGTSAYQIAGVSK